MPREVTVVVDDRTIKYALTTNHLNRFFFSINSNNSRTIDAASYEPAVYNTFRFMMDELKTVEFMDVGANFGWFSNIVATSPLNRCLAIEIDKKFFRELVLCTNWNSSISPMYKGASREESIIKRTSIFSYSGIERALIDAFDPYVQLDSLDNLAKKNSMTSVNLVKIDVEGSELDVLEGASGLIREHQPVFIIEIHPELVMKISTKHWTTLLEHLKDYSLFTFDSNRSETWKCRSLSSKDLKRNDNFTIVAISSQRRSIISRFEEKFKLS